MQYTFPPIKKGRAREQDYWTPKNYDGTEGGTLTLRRALENSRNLATAHLLKGGIEDKPEASLERLCQLALEAQIYRECVHLYPFVLGAEPVECLTSPEERVSCSRGPWAAKSATRYTGCV